MSLAGRTFWSVIAFSAVVAAVAFGFGAARRVPEALAQADDASYAAWRDRPSAPFGQGKAVFESMVRTLRTRYVDQGLSEDEIYRAAAAGLMEHVGDGRGDAWNKLLSPVEHAELLADLKGEIAGVGLDFRFEDASGMGVVNAVLPHTPADEAGLRAGDRILKVDGRSFAGKQLRDMVYAIRGPVGTTVTLTILRDAATFPVTLTRARLDWEEVEADVMDGGVGILGIRSFTANTPAKVRKALEGLRGRRISSLVLDLRQCPGGSFTAAVDTTSLFLAKGTPIVRVKERGGREDVKSASADPVLPRLPLGVVMSGETASGCELMAAALRQGAGAVLIGSKSKGKWSMQTVEVLPNRYAMKFTVARFLPPHGEDPAGHGLRPDVPVNVAVEEDPARRTLPLAERAAEDPALQAARRYVSKAQP